MSLTNLPFPGNAEFKLQRISRFFTRLGAGIVALEVFMMAGWEYDYRNGDPAPLWAYWAVGLCAMLGPTCLAAGIGVKRRREWARKLTLGLVWVGIPSIIATFALSEAQRYGNLGESPWKTHPADFAVNLAILLVVAGVYVLKGRAWLTTEAGFLNSDEVKGLFQPKTDRESAL